MAYFVFQTKFLHCRCTVTAADYTACPFGGGLDNSQSDSFRSFIERRYFKDTHRPVPNDGLGINNLLCKHLGCNRPNIDCLITRINVTHGNAVWCARLQLANHLVIHRQDYLTAHLGCLIQQFLALVNEVVLAQALTDVLAPAFEKRICHGPTDNDAIDLVYQILNHTYLV